MTVPFNSNWKGVSLAGVGVFMKGGWLVLLLLIYKAMERSLIQNALYVCEGRGEESALQEPWALKIASTKSEENLFLPGLFS